MKFWAFVILCAQIAASPLILKVRVHGKIQEIPLEQYVVAAVAGEGGVFHSLTAAKAMAVTTRTYAVRMRGRHRTEGFDLCDTTHCQSLQFLIGGTLSQIASTETKGELLWFEGKPAFTPYSKDCGGTTEAANTVWPDLAQPYLKVHDDPYCRRAAEPGWQWIANAAEVQAALRGSSLRGPSVIDGISVLQRTASGRASMLMLFGGAESVRISASSLRFAIGRQLGWNTVRSDKYEVRCLNGRLVFDGRGQGHGVGLCQRGAEQLGLSGRTYREILAFYYPGTVAGLTGSGLSWTSLKGNSITLLTTQPDRDKAKLGTAETIAARVSQRMHWTLPPDIEIRAYPDLDTYRNATGEPGWVAAHATGTTIELQPIALLQSGGVLETTLTHELLHVMLEWHAAPGLPIWFREGMVLYFAGDHRPKGIARVPQDAELRQTADPGKARRAYNDSASMIAVLARRYGDAALLNWVVKGLPLEVTNASSRAAIPNSR